MTESYRYTHIQFYRVVTRGPAGSWASGVTDGVGESPALGVSEFAMCGRCRSRCEHVSRVFLSS